MPERGGAGAGQSGSSQKTRPREREVLQAGGFFTAARRPSTVRSDLWVKQTPAAFFDDSEGNPGFSYAPKSSVQKLIKTEQRVS